MDSNFLCASGPELSILANTIAIYISQLYDADDLLSIAYFVETLGNNLSLIGNQKFRCENSIKLQNNVDLCNNTTFSHSNQNINKLE